MKKQSHINHASHFNFLCYIWNIKLTEKTEPVASMSIAALSKNSIFISIQDVSVDINESLMLIYLIAGPRPFRKWAITEKIQPGGLSTYVLEKDPWNF